MKRLLASKLFFVIALLYSCSLLFVSLIRIKDQSLPIHFNGADKVFHLFAYFGLVLLWKFYFLSRDKHSGRWQNLLICLLAIVFGIIVEVVQYSLTTYRSFEYFDILANLSGVILAFVILVLFVSSTKTS